MLTNAENLRGLHTSFVGDFHFGLEQAQAKLCGDKLVMITTSTSAENLYSWLCGLPQMREWVGDREVNRLAEEAFAIKNKKFENTVSVSRTAIEDDQAGNFSHLFQDLGYQAATHFDKLIFETLDAGFTMSCWDGVPLYSANHPTGKKTEKQSNLTVASESAPPWFLVDGSRPSRPFIKQIRQLARLISIEDPKLTFLSDNYVYGADSRGAVGPGLYQLVHAVKGPLNKASFEAARLAMRQMRGFNQRKLGVSPTICIVGPENESAANDLFKTTQINGTTNTLYNAVEVIVNPY